MRLKDLIYITNSNESIDQPIYKNQADQVDSSNESESELVDSEPMPEDEVIQRTAQEYLDFNLERY
jgi:hypothetical protein